MQLSIVMPAHNEGDHIQQCVSEWMDVVVSKVPESELLVVDDCSTDDTLLRLRALESRFPQLRVLRTPANVGHGRAVRIGLDSSTGDFVFQTDSDRQHSPEDFWTLWAERQKADFVFGVRASRADGVVRLLISRTMRVANFLMWGHWIADANCPFKLMRGVPMRRVLTQVPVDTFIPMVMVSILARREGYRIADVRVRHFPRTAGQQSLAGLVKWASVGTRCIRELYDLRTSTHRGTQTSLEPLPTRAKIE
jgi:dolichol-phosphate mannosyltransferase